MALIEFKNLPDTSAPLNAENLNNNFNELKKAYDGTILYENSDGEFEVTLSDSVSNYKKIEILVKTSNVSWETTVTVLNPNGKNIPIHIPSFYFNDASNYGVTDMYALINISGTSITKSRTGSLNNSNVATLTDYIKILKVIGYK